MLIPPACVLARRGRRVFLIAITCCHCCRSIASLSPSTSAAASSAAFVGIGGATGLRRLIGNSEVTATRIPRLPRITQQLCSRRPAYAAMSSSDEGGDINDKGGNDGDGGLFLFDFDGVVCDSCDECTVSALRTCRRLGVLSTEHHDEIPEYPPKWLFDRMREIRPAIEVGWQIPVLLSAFLDRHRGDDGDEGSDEEAGADDPVGDILANYEHLVDDALTRWNKTPDDMIDAFGSVRDEWIASDLDSWLDINSFYPGVPESLNSCRGESVLVTTKQQRFAIALCRHAGVTTDALPDDDVYGLGMYGGKADVITDRMKSGGYRPEHTRFFEDRWPTLEKCLRDKRLNGVRFYLCSWGYVTEEELGLAGEEPRVEVLDLDGFADVVSSSPPPLSK